jgi:thiol-disulfide isomerase/thioredoxin
MIGVCLCLMGCSLFDKNKQANGSGGSSTGASTASKDKGDPLFGATTRANPPVQPPGAAPPTVTILAGRVVDRYDQGLGNASIRLARAEEKDGSASREVSVNPDGFFTIENVRPGAEYKLVARAKNGERMLAGISYTTAPNSHLLITMKEEFANGDTPAVPGPPSIPGKPPAKSTSLEPDPEFTPTLGSIDVPLSGQTVNTDPNPNPSPFPRASAALLDGSQDLPMSIAIPVANTPASNSGTPTSVVPLGQASASLTTTPRPDPIKPPWPPNTIIDPPKRNATEELKQPVPAPRPPIPSPSSGADDGQRPPPPNLNFDAPSVSMPVNPVPPSTARSANIGPVRVPSCQVENRHLINFALYELNGSMPWEYRNHTGKVVLIDFWGTWCPPCVQTLPKLRDLRSRYGSKGLEVIGIACEREGSPQAQAQKVNALCLSKHINYRQLLSSGPNCPVTNQFNVHSFPTLVLLDETGEVIWRHEGFLNPSAQDVLERHIERLLNLQP